MEVVLERHTSGHRWINKQRFMHRAHSVRRMIAPERMQKTTGPPLLPTRRVSIVPGYSPPTTLGDMGVYFTGRPPTNCVWCIYMYLPSSRGSECLGGLPILIHTHICQPRHPKQTSPTIKQCCYIFFGTHLMSETGDCNVYAHCS